MRRVEGKSTALIACSREDRSFGSPGLKSDCLLGFAFTLPSDEHMDLGGMTEISWILDGISMIRDQYRDV